MWIKNSMSYRSKIHKKIFKKGVDDMILTWYSNTCP